MTYKFDIDALKAMDISGLSKCIDIALSRLIYPQDMTGWKEGDCMVLIVKTIKADDFAELRHIQPIWVRKSCIPVNGMLELEGYGNLLALRYLHFLFKQKVAELTGVPATNNNDVDWEYHSKDKK